MLELLICAKNFATVMLCANCFFCRIKEEVHTSHRANIFSAQFLPETSDHQIISCAGDGAILHTDILRQENTLNSFFNCHGGTVYEVAIVPGDPNSFLTCGEDGTVRWFDLRTKGMLELALYI